MKKLPVAFFGLVLSVGLAEAADMPRVIPEYRAPVPLWSWTGPYAGVQVGGGFGTSQFTDPTGPSIYGGNVRSPAALGGALIGYNWQVPNSTWLFGVETDANLLSADGTNTCLASSGFFISANCRVRQDAMGSLTGRFGVATGTGGRTLLYAKGGGAWLHERIDLTTNGIPPEASTPTNFNGMRWGWTVGAGLEKALTPAWSVKLEYDYTNFGSASVGTPASYLQVIPPFSNGYIATAGGTSNVSQNVHTVKLGVNLRLDQDAYGRWDPPASDYRLRGSTERTGISDGEIEVGTRAWYSSGKYQKDLGGTTNQAQQGLLVSRLTYDTNAASGELFGRIDSDSNFFLKGFIGGGTLVSGKMHDEDWVIFNDTVPYSNTLSNPVKGDIGYATVDVGYSLFHGPSSKVGGFIGYNYFRENKAAYGCTQIANQSSDCVPSIANTVLGITEDDRWNSLRVGLNGVVKLTDNLTLTADAAYLPYVSFRGVDNHLLRTDVANTVSTASGNGQGVQLEAILSYAIGRSFSVGAGGRYWAMWATDATTNIFGTGCPCQTLPSRTERYGAFVEASYKWDGFK